MLWGMFWGLDIFFLKAKPWADKEKAENKLPLKYSSRLKLIVEK